MHLFIKSEAGIFMWNKKGSSLIESLFALEIYLCVLIVFTGLFVQTFYQENQLSKKYQTILEKEALISYENDFMEVIKEVLH